jgi:hypothetical protein
MVGLFFRVCVCRGACLAFCFLLCIWLCRLVYVMSCLCVCVCVCCVGCCVNSYRLVGCVSISRLMGVVEKVRLGDLHPSSVFGLTLGVRLFFLLWDCVLCLY